jgi:hypothetical protein
MAPVEKVGLGDRVVWIGKDGYQPTGLGTITRITAHEVEVRWDNETLVRYRRVHLHNLRHMKPFSETVDGGRDVVDGDRSGESVTARTDHRISVECLARR